MTRAQIASLLVLALATIAWLNYLDRPTRRNLERAIIRTLAL
jgi:hypothetical protein